MRMRETIMGSIVLSFTLLLGCVGGGGKAVNDGCSTRTDETSIKGEVTRDTLASNKSVIEEPLPDTREAKSDALSTNKPVPNNNGVNKPASNLFPPPAILLETSSNYEKNKSARAALQYINHINHVIAKLQNFNDLLIFQQEYEALTDNNLNLEAINDETTVQVITELLDVLKKMTNEKVKVLYAQATLEREKKAALYKAIPSPAGFMIASTNPVTLAIAVGGAALTSVQNYYAAKAAAEQKFEDKLFESGKEKLEGINELNKELLYSQWRLMHNYNIPDAKRITRQENDLFLGFAKLLDKSRSNTSSANTTRNDEFVWKIFKNNEDEMRELPFYWVTRASAAAKLIPNQKRGDNSATKDLYESCRNYFRLFQDAPIIRKDPTACSMALLYVSTLPKPKNDEEKQHIRAWLRFIEKMVRVPAWQTKFSIAQLYVTLLNDREEAQRIIERTFLEVHACLEIWVADEKRNIFIPVPAFEQAYGDQTTLKKDLPNWEKDAQDLLPISGWFWLKDAWLSLIEDNANAMLEWEKYDCPIRGKIGMIGADCEVIELLRDRTRSPRRLQEAVKVSQYGDAFTIETPKGFGITLMGAKIDNNPIDSAQWGEGTITLRYATSNPPREINVFACTDAGFTLGYTFHRKDGFVLTKITLRTPWRLNEEVSLF